MLDEVELSPAYRLLAGCKHRNDMLRVQLLHLLSDGLPHNTEGVIL